MFYIVIYIGTYASPKTMKVTINQSKCMPIYVEIKVKYEYVNKQLIVYSSRDVIISFIMQ